MKKLKFVLLFAAAVFLLGVNGAFAKKYNSYKGLVMCGYQGWGATPADGSERGWGAYGAPGNKFQPGDCAIDYWPEMSEYEVQYETPFKYADGSTATIFSPHDASSVDLHFKWMKEAGIDGVFMQRFVGNARPGSRGKAHFDIVFDNAMKAAQKYGRTIALMYDLSGLRDGDDQMILNDWKEISEKYGIYKRDKGYDCYLHHNGKPLLAIWGVGFIDRPYDYTMPENLIKTLKDKNNPLYCSIHLGVPTYWREFGRDIRKEDQPKLHELIKLIDVVHPWTPGRYKNAETYEAYKPNIAKDIAWAKANGIDFAAGVFPGFSWYNKALWEFAGQNHPSNATPRLGGRFFWMQLAGAINEGAQMIYVSMFDEIEEGTAIYKLSKNPPVGKSPFVALEPETPSDHYMWLAGQASKALKAKKNLPVEMPTRKVKK